MLFTSPKLHSVSFHDQSFSRYCPFGDKCTEWPPKTLNPTRSNYRICISSAIESQISVIFTLQSADFKIHAILRQMRRITPKWPWTLQGHRCLTYVWVKDFTPFCSTTSRFRVFGHFETSEQNYPKNDLEHYRVKDTLYMRVLLMSQGPKFHPIFLYDQPFSRYKVVDNRKCTKWHQNDFEYLTVKSTLYTLNIYLPGQNILLFHSTTNCFQDHRSSWKSAKYEMHRMTSDRSWTLNNQIYPICTKSLPLGPNLVAFCSTASRFRDTSLSKIGKITSYWFWTLNDKSTLYIKF